MILKIKSTQSFITMYKIKLIISIMLIFTAGCSSTIGKNFNTGINVSSWENIDKQKFNQVITQAYAEGKAWVFSPEPYAFYLFNLTELKNYNIKYDAKSSENNNESTLIIVRDGFLDDSVRGDIHSLILTNQTDFWAIKELKKSTRCWRSRSSEYHSERCE